MATAEALSAPLDLTEAQALAELLQALGDPTRLRILSALDMACVSVGALVQATGLRQPTISHHLRILRDRGVVRAERRGTYIYYCAVSEALRPTLNAAHALLDARSVR
ncbi:MAG: ArsR/SmtB family transcription factor [Solirubrobacteraceae bacterium]